jgi:hypothetical protein
VDRLLAGTHGVVTQVYLDPKTFLPVTITQSARPGEDSTNGVTTSIEGYQRLTPSEAATSVLAMRPRPGARCVLRPPLGPGGAVPTDEGRAGTGEPCAHIRTTVAFHPPAGCNAGRCTVTGVPRHPHVVPRHAP